MPLWIVLQEPHWDHPFHCRTVYGVNITASSSSSCKESYIKGIAHKIGKVHQRYGVRMIYGIQTTICTYLRGENDEVLLKGSGMYKLQQDIPLMNTEEAGRLTKTGGLIINMLFSIGLIFCNVHEQQELFEHPKDFQVS